MPNAIKYSTSAQTLALKKGNFWIGTGDVPKGETLTTDYWNGVTPASGGYTIYLNKATQGPSIYNAANDDELIFLTNKIVMSATTSYTTVSECLNYYVGQSDKMVFNRDYPAIPTNGITFIADVGTTLSYPLNSNRANTFDPTTNGGFISYDNGTAYVSEYGGGFQFDGVDDVAYCTATSSGFGLFLTAAFTWVIICRSTTSTWSGSGGSLSITNNNYSDGTGWTIALGTSTRDVTFYMGSNGSAFTVNIGTITPATVSTPNMYVISSNGTNLHKGYVNGTSSISNSTSTTRTSNQHEIFVGRNGYTSACTGMVSYVQIMYNRQLSDAEVLQLYSAYQFRFGFFNTSFNTCKTCKDIIDTFPQMAGNDGLYWIYPGGPNGTPRQVYCDMTTDSGGWTLVARSHPTTVNYNGKNWGWKGGAIGSINDFSQAYQLGWGEIWDGNATFSSYIFGNQRTNIDNSWGPFVYKVSSINYSTFFNSDTSQSYSYSTLKSNTSVYGTTSFPPMQGTIGYTTTATNNNIYYMRDIPGYSSFGGTPLAMVTVYCGGLNSGGSWTYYSGPWCGGTSSTGIFYNSNVSTSNGLTHGGTNQYIIMVR
jgi:hypothetical protein